LAFSGILAKLEFSPKNQSRLLRSDRENIREACFVKVKTFSYFTVDIGFPPGIVLPAETDNG